MARKMLEDKTGIKKIAVPRLRLLPFVIVVAGLMLTVKVGGVWEDLANPPESLTLERQTAVAQSPAPAPAPADQPPLPTDAAGQPAPDADAATDMAPPPDGGAAASGEAAPEQSGEPTAFTQNEISLLQNLAVRREELDARERELDQRDAILAASERQIEGKIMELKDLEQVIADRIAEYNKLEEGKYQKIVKIYESMKPKEAARIFDTLDMAELILVAEGMKEQKIAAVMAKMNPEKAKALTIEMENRRQLPPVGSNPGG